jgi:hypothetical protein
MQGPAAPRAPDAWGRFHLGPPFDGVQSSGQLLVTALATGTQTCSGYLAHCAGLDECTQVLRVSLLDVQSRSTGALLGGLVYADTFLEVGGYAAKSQ